MPALTNPERWIPFCAVVLALAGAFAPSVAVAADHGHEAAPVPEEAASQAQPSPATAGRKRTTAASAPTPAPDPLASIGERIAERIRIRSIAPGHDAVVHVGAHAAIDGNVGAATKGTQAGKPAHAEGSGHWGYEGAEGPQAWAQLQPEFGQCSKGARQSPIDIQGGIKVQLDPVMFDYKPGPFRVVDNGHTIQVNVEPGSSIEVMGRRFELLQFHFHRPSEERIDGRQFDMVVHLVHKDLEGRLAVVAVLLERGSSQPVVQRVWNNLPLEKGDEVPVRAALDPARLLPVERGYYTYMGSLTTPPCSEGVLWMVMKTPMSISPDQLGIFARLYPMNARPVQSASGRLIKESE